MHLLRSFLRTGTAALWALGLLFLCGQSIAASTSVNDGKDLYFGAVAITGGGSGKCSACHYSGAPPSLAQSITAPNHNLASNNPSQITGAIAAMYMSYPGITAAELFKLSMYIGQYKAPVPSNATLSINTSVTNVGTVNVYPLLATNGSSGVAQDSGGLTSTNGSEGSTTADITNPTSTSIQYNLQYTRTNTSFVGTDTFTYKVINPAATNPASNTVTVILVGITSAATASGVVGQSFNYNITTNGTTSGGSPYSISGGSLPASLALNPATGAVTGTPSAGEAGSYSFTVAVSTTVGTVNKTVTLTVSGISSASAANYVQGTPISTYQITTYPTPTAGYGLTGSLPSGLSFNSGTGQITGTPSAAGSFPVTVSATANGVSVSQALTITVGPIPVVSTTGTVLPASTPTVVGTVGTAITNIVINGTNGPISSYSISGGSLPPGLGLAGATISGTPTTSGDYPLTLTATNGNGPGNLAVIMRINATGAPVISSGATGTGTVGTAGTAYTIMTTAANGPVTSYSVVSGSLPAGLTLNTSTGVVSGIPTASGISSVTLGAVNSGGLTGSLAVTFTITPNALPVISSPSNGTTTALALGAAMTPINITASNPPLTAFALTSGTLPTGVSLNTTTGVISGTPTVPGASSAVTLTASNAVGTSTAVTVNFSVGVPAPTACNDTTTLNTAKVIDLKACMFPSLSPTGFTVSMQPAHGTLNISGVNATYTPANGFFGTDSFTAVAQFSGGATSTAGTVTISISGRPNPLDDTRVTGLLAAQAEAARKFADTQTGNINRRLEALHSTMLPPAGSSAGVAPPTTSFANTTTTPRTTTSAQLAAIGSNNAIQLPASNAQASLPLSSAVSMAATQAGLSQSPLYNLASDFVQNRSINLGTLSRVGMGLHSDLPGEAAPGPGVWAEGVVSFGTRDANGSVSAADFSSSGVSFGVDRALSERLVVGMGVGYAQDTTNIGTDGTRNQTRGYSLAVYGSYKAGSNSFVDGMVGVGSLEFDMNRYVPAASAYAVGNRKGYQLFGSLGTGFEFRDKANMISPYARLDFSTDKLGENTETGAGTFSLTYHEQTNSALQATLGLRGESIHATPFGWALPRARVEWRQDLSSRSEAAISYADQVGGTRYTVSPNGSLQSALVLGIGSEFLFRDGWALGVDYQLTQVSAYESSYALRIKLLKELGVKGLRNLLKGVEQEFSDENEIQVDAGYTWDDNITRAKLNSDIRADSIYTFNASQTRMFFLSGNTRLLLTGSAGGERFQTFNGLSNINLGAEAAYQYRESAEFDAPTYGVFAKVTALKHQASLRDGYKSSVGLTASRPLTDRITVFGALASNQRWANSA
ncbi:MAG: autotransporter domain-containing protein, partial [Rhodoferax sp.]